MIKCIYKYVVTKFKFNIFFTSKCYINMNEYVNIKRRLASVKLRDSIKQ
jgi:hypothetical protein